jgi:hypothetical protein
VDTAIKGKKKTTSLYDVRKCTSDDFLNVKANSFFDSEKNKSTNKFLNCFDVPKDSPLLFGSNRSIESKLTLVVNDLK